MGCVWHDQAHPPPGLPLEGGGGLFWTYDFVGFAAFPHPLLSPADAGEGELVIRRYKYWRFNQTYMRVEYCRCT